jgi:hypothetical protein
MRRIIKITATLAFGALASAAPASAQLVNGLSGPNYNHDAPIGTKSGGSVSSLRAPGETAAIAGALRNEMDAKNMAPVTGTLNLGPINGTLSAKAPVARSQTVASNETSQERLSIERLANSSD